MKTTNEMQTWNRKHSHCVARDCLRLARRWMLRGNRQAMQTAFDLAMEHRRQARKW